MYTNDTSMPTTQHCTSPVSQLNGTGFEDPPQGTGLPGVTTIPGGSTPWLSDELTGHAGRDA